MVVISNYMTIGVMHKLIKNKTKMTIFNKELKERVRLLEHENQELKKRLKWVEDKIGSSHPPILHSKVIREDGWDMSYDVLRKKYRNYTPVFKD